MENKNKIALVIHGGAGTILRSQMTAEKEFAYTTGLREALESGWKVLRENGSAMDAVESAVRSLEDCPLFNAGKGAVFTHDEKNELDASIMCGKTLNAGAVSFVRNVKNPISLARLVMQKTEHVMLAGDGAMVFAKENGVEFVLDDYFFTEFRYNQLLEAKKEGRVQLDHAKPIGTVGAVACDSNGNLAAATSTGGMTNKLYGRIGDTPIIGAGTYADNTTCAVSCTGHGEYFMRAVTAYDIACRMKYANATVDEAATAAVEYLRSIDGEGGLIAVDSYGNVSLPFNSDGMYRGWITQDGEFNIKIYKD
jgi:L-asparaginase / beta-aspartyl-peptidase